MKTAVKIVASEALRELKPNPQISKFYHFYIKKDDKNKPILPPDSYKPQTVSLLDFIGKPAPIEVEIGCGKGSFLIPYADLSPQRPILGIDQVYSIAKLAADRIAKRPHLPFTRVLWGDAFYFLRDFLPSSSVCGFHMYFPDPWPKKRHRKRRLLNKDFLQVIYKAAAQGARFYWATDFKNYHEESVDLFRSQPWLSILEENAQPTSGITTNFEKKYLKEGREIFRLVMGINKTAADSF